MTKLLDKDGYPTRTALKKIERWNAEDVIGLVEFIRELWWMSDDGLKFRRKGRRFQLELHTFGWSGNEDIIEALKKNWIFWSSYWYKTIVGGHYYFRGKLK